MRVNADFACDLLSTECNEPVLEAIIKTLQRFCTYLRWCMCDGFLAMPTRNNHRIIMYGLSWESLCNSKINSASHRKQYEHPIASQSQVNYLQLVAGLYSIP